MCNFGHNAPKSYCYKYNIQDITTECQVILHYDAPFCTSRFRRFALISKRKHKLPYGTFAAQRHRTHKSCPVRCDDTDARPYRVRDGMSFEIPLHRARRYIAHTLRQTQRQVMIRYHFRATLFISLQCGYPSGRLPRRVAPRNDIKCVARNDTVSAKPPFQARFLTY